MISAILALLIGWLVGNLLGWSMNYGDQFNWRVFCGPAPYTKWRSKK
ncbi:hypothetical protein HPO96_37065 [Kribbella sandramycini]|uniref:Uncharacterized protein n=1 Tax=Kribbella sandramycini TaxID=60450 RepID=A0A7Y4L9U4_9ACTN|nr:hypothetical protein [Kribbella sandramycini]MBB6564409.1 hypothetical protein [Kribbella sandramycini]NOL45871.1 hypothetical protein [Kribbella sandramycini]